MRYICRYICRDPAIISAGGEAEYFRTIHADDPSEAARKAERFTRKGYVLQSAFSDWSGAD